MTKITRISETRRGRFALFSEEEFLFSVDGETLAVSHLEVGTVLEDSELHSLKQNSDTRKAKDSALRFLSLRAYGEMELYKKLCLKHDEHSAASAIADMAELGLLDDRTFAVNKAEWLVSRGKSQNEIRLKLREAGLDKELIQEVLEGLDLDEANLALKLLYKSYLPKLERGEYQKVKAALARRGFNYRDINEALAKVEEELGLGNDTSDMY